MTRQRGEREAGQRGGDPLREGFNESFKFRVENGVCGSIRVGVRISVGACVGVR
jgi:hypothetical protein